MIERMNLRASSPQLVGRANCGGDLALLPNARPTSGKHLLHLLFLVPDCFSRILQSGSITSCHCPSAMDSQAGSLLILPIGDGVGSAVPSNITAYGL